MVRKSLRLRIVATFIGIVLTSLILSFILFMQFSENNNTPNHMFISIAEDIAKVINLIDDPEKVNAFRDLLNRFSIDIAIVNEPSDAVFSLDKEKISTLFNTNTTDAVFLSGKGGLAIVGIPKIDDEKGAFIIKIDFSSIVRG